MPDKSVILQREGRVAIVTLNRPQKMNSFDEAMMAEIDEAVSECARDPNIGAVILTGVGRAFCAGIDVAYLMELGSSGRLPHSVVESLSGKDLISAVVKLRDMRKPVIAAVNGHAIGGGMSLALACDIRIASENASFAMMQVKRGVVPDAGGTYLLANTVGLSRAMRIALTGDSIDAARAEKWGLVDEVVPPEKLVAHAKELANRIASNPPLAVEAIKEAMYRAALEHEMAAQMNYELRLMRMLFETGDFKEGVNSFLEKRPPVFKGK